MQVSHQQDTITHAVIGGGKALDFGISDSAAFFNILSSTLYKDQLLAVVREVLCNAWDAHIETGITDKPVEVTLTDTKFSVRDFGKGIHNDDMGVIYCVYGNSTKKNDGKQTGGFGLGCKAPLAYVEHFDVISHHDGVKTLYKVAKSSAQAQGKPGLTPIVSIPTTESGLDVSLEIKNARDYLRFTELIKRIVRNGDMNVSLNGAVLPKLNFDSNKSNYILLTNTKLLNEYEAVMVRYGNVIYPVSNNNGYAAEYVTILDHLRLLGRNSGEYSIVFQAPPHSIAVTPSREELSMQEHTINTLKDIFKSFTSMLKKEFIAACYEHTKVVIDEAVKNVSIPELLHPQDCLPSVVKTYQVDQLIDLPSMAKRYMAYAYPQGWEYRRKDIAYRLQAMGKGGLLDRGLAQKLIKHLKVIDDSWNTGRNDNWLARNITAPVVTALKDAGMDHQRLYVYDSNDPSAVGNRYERSYLPIVPAINAFPRSINHLLPYLRNIVVIASSKTNLGMRCLKHPVFKELGKFEGFLFYHTGTKKGDRDKAVEFFTELGVNVVDLTFKQDYEGGTEAYVKPVRKPVKKGAPLLSDINRAYRVNTGWITHDDVKRIEQPEFIAQVSLAKDVPTNQIDIFDEVTTKFVIELFGEKGALTTTKATYEKYIQKGAKPLREYVIGKVTDFMMNDPTIKEYWAFHVDRVTSNIHYWRKEAVELCYKSPELRNQFGLVNNLTDEAKKYLRIWQRIKEYRRNNAEVKTVSDYLDAIPVDQKNLDLLKKFENSKLVPVLDFSELVKTLNHYDEASPEGIAALQIFTLALNN